jgi:hypothetical protein
VLSFFLSFFLPDGKVVKNIKLANSENHHIIKRAAVQYPKSCSVRVSINERGILIGVESLPTLSPEIE